MARMAAHFLCDGKLHREALGSQKPSEGLLESLSRLHADDAAVMQLVAIWLDLITSKDLKAHKGMAEKQVRDTVECFCCFVSVALRVFEFRAGREVGM